MRESCFGEEVDGLKGGCDVIYERFQINKHDVQWVVLKRMDNE